ncbi:hypothetical protein QBC47DRAFT_371941 [Echria macrotheca]|uniref:SigF-like NTF2-like domain-containing protein n=1 Tax=Echria macrotheca TaxID=438768 RepID=A0AAJ0BK63_9PEZI|nr:hypothetical protein QBC47DRAFT_371941 [Echria macrotheca]
MDHPVKDIRGVIRSLCQGSPEEQQHAIAKYFVPSASFVHPFCRVPSFEGVRVPAIGNVDSRMLILNVYKWYKLLSPKIEVEIESAVFDQRTNTLYVTVSQVFSMWFLPFHAAPVKLVTVLTLDASESSEQKDGANGTAASSSSSSARDNNAQNKSSATTAVTTPLGDADNEPTFAEVVDTSIDTSSAVDTKTAQPKSRRATSTSVAVSSGSESRRKYRILKQEDYYQPTDAIKFILLGPGAALYSWLQIIGTALCLIGVMLAGPIFQAFFGVAHFVDRKRKGKRSEQRQPQQKPRVDGPADGADGAAPNGHVSRSKAE